MSRIATDMTGQRFERLLVIEEAGRDSRRRARWLCQCDCGAKRMVYGSNLRSGATTSCGCRNREATVARHTTHGLYGHPLYGTWRSMRQRCEDRNTNRYAYYGGADPPVKVCERWSGPDGFANFLADMGERPSPWHSLSRFGDVGDYEPTNVRWATWAEQGGEKKTKHAAREAGYR